MAPNRKDSNSEETGGIVISHNEWSEFKSDLEAIKQCLIGDALNNKDGLVHAVKRLEDNTQILRKQHEEHAARQDKVEKELGIVKAQRKVILYVLGLGGTGIGASLAKYFGGGSE